LSFTHEDGRVLSEFVWLLMFSFCFGLKIALNMKFYVLTAMIVCCLSPCSVVHVCQRFVGTYGPIFGVEELWCGTAV